MSVLGFALVYLLACSGPQFEDTPRPNILFVFADDHAYQAISAYGSRINLAKEGMRFDRCVVTNSICAPSRAVILTGKDSHLNGVIFNIAKAESEAMVQPNRVANDLGWKAMASIQGSHRSIVARCP